MTQVYQLVVLGAGESGVGAALLAQAKGFTVFVSDLAAIAPGYKAQLESAGIPYEEKQHTEALILTANEVIKSPGIPDKAPLIKALRAQGTPVISEIEFALRYTKAKTIGITGSNGKTTTTLLTYHLLKHAGFKVGLAGNVGHSLAVQVIQDQFEWYVLELSSFQLDGMEKARLDIAVLLNITPDHLDRYNYQFELYAASKFRILQNQGPDQVFITCLDQEGPVASYITHNTISPSVQLVGDSSINGLQAWYTEDQLQFKDGFAVPSTSYPIHGKHNWLNMLCAISAARAAGVPDHQILTALPTFRNAPHRLEPVGQINGVLYVNDSKATNVDSVFYALQSFKQPLVLILGGVDKGNDYNQIADLVLKHVKALVFMGTDNSPLLQFFGQQTRFGHLPQEDTHSLPEALEAATSLATAGDVVLLSPACASFDLFKNYEDRGNQFKTWVQAHK